MGPMTPLCGLSITKRVQQNDDDDTSGSCSIAVVTGENCSEIHLVVTFLGSQSLTSRYGISVAKRLHGVAWQANFKGRLTFPNFCRGLSERVREIWRRSSGCRCRFSYNKCCQAALIFYAFFHGAMVSEKSNQLYDPISALPDQLHFSPRT